MEVSKRLPTIKDFRLYGRFHSLPKLDIYNDIPLSILYYVFPNYFIIQEKIKPEILDFLKQLCMMLKDEAEYEDRMENLKDQKELQIRRLEDRIHSYYLNINQTCKCKSD